MAFTIETYYKVIRPKSLTDSAYEPFEFVLKWEDRKGGIHWRLFTDKETNIKVSASQINADDSEAMENIISGEDRRVTLVAENYSKNDLQAFVSILTARIIERVYKDGTKERVGVKSNSYKYKETGGRYNIEFEIVLYNRPLPK